MHIGFITWKEFLKLNSENFATDQMNSIFKMIYQWIKYQPNEILIDIPFLALTNKLPSYISCIKVFVLVVFTYRIMSYLSACLSNIIYAHTHYTNYKILDNDLDSCPYRYETGKKFAA